MAEGKTPRTAISSIVSFERDEDVPKVTCDLLEFQGEPVRERAAQTASRAGDVLSETNDPLSLKGVTILIVDDISAVRRALQRSFMRHQANVLLAEGAEDALAQFASLPSNSIILLDDSMPDGRGVTIAPTLHEQRPDLLIYLHSGSKPSEVRGLIQKGIVRAFVPKPLDAEGQKALIRTILAHR